MYFYYSGLLSLCIRKANAKPSDAFWRHLIENLVVGEFVKRNYH
ncbi:MAG: hypothetical protein ACRCVT_15200 [Leadbetterella sp.]